MDITQRKSHFLTIVVYKDLVWDPPYITTNHYTQDIQNNIKKGTIIKFADDNNLVIGNKKYNSLIETVNFELEKIYQYTKANNLIINSEKSNYMIFKPTKPQNRDQTPTNDILINGKPLRKISEARYLGVIIDDKLNFKAHTSKVMKKLREATNALRCTRYSLSYKAKILIYHSLFASHLDYCSIVWHDKLNKKQWNEITKLQKKAIRICFNAKNKSHTAPLFKLAKVTPATKIYERDCILLVYRSTNEVTRSHQPAEINKLLKRDPIKYNTRLGWNKNIIKINRKYKKGDALYSILTEWNKPENDIYGNLGNISVVKEELKEEHINKITICIKPNCKLCEMDNTRMKLYEKYIQK